MEQKIQKLKESRGTLALELEGLVNAETRTETQVYKKTVYPYLCILTYLKISSQTHKKINSTC